MKIVSWNINGIRSLRKDVKTILDELEADIACFQETKITKELMTERLALVDGYRSYFSYSKARAGYSGVVTYCKRDMQPVNATDSLVSPLGEEECQLTFSLSADILKALDSEGRTLITQHTLHEAVDGKSLLTLINVYCPCVTGEKDGRELFRLQFLQTLEERITQLRLTSHVILLGDINISHRMIDSCDPGEESEFVSQAHRQWLDRILCAKKGVLLDTFRILNPDKKFAYTCWNTKIGARQTNFGTRIDYILIDKAMRDCLSTAEVLSKYLGSDHCPVGVGLTNISIRPSTTAATLCSSNRYKAKQQKLTMFLSKSASKTGQNDPFDSFTADSVPLKEEKKKRKTAIKTSNHFWKRHKPATEPSKGSDTSGVQLKEGNEPVLCADTLADAESQSSLTTESDTCSQSLDSTSDDQVGQKANIKAWAKVFTKQTQQAPVCSGHKDKCVLQTVKKPGANLGRQFYRCSRPVGLPGDKECRCSRPVGLPGDKQCRCSRPVGLPGDKQCRCSRPVGLPGDKQCRCSYFKWADKC